MHTLLIQRHLAIVRDFPLSTESTKVTFLCLADIKADLDHYAALHEQTYSEAVDAVTTLIPCMLEAFMAADRGFRRAQTRNEKTAFA
jgi:hypothetical protein